MNKKNFALKIKQMVIAIMTTMFGATLGGLAAGRGGTSLTIFQPAWWIGSIIGLSLVIFIRDDAGKPRYRDERFYQKRNSFINIWCWCSAVVATFVMAYLTFQGVTDVRIPQVALGLGVFIFGIAAIEAYVRLRP